MALEITFHGKPWLIAPDPVPNWQPDYESEKWKMPTMYTRSFEDWEKIRNMGLVREFPQVTYFTGLAVEYDKLPKDNL